jgi:hypothetical protein
MASTTGAGAWASMSMGMIRFGKRLSRIIENVPDFRFRTSLKEIKA